MYHGRGQRAEDSKLRAENCDLLVLNGALMTMAGGNTELCLSGFVAIRGGEIAAVGPMAAAPDPASAGTVVDAGGQLVMPGLVNCHSHAAMTLFRGLADDLPLMTWLYEHIFPAEARWVDPDMVYWCSKLAAAEMLLAGITTAADGYFYEYEAGRAFQDAGLRAVAAQGVIDFPAPGVPDPAGNVTTAADFIAAWQGRTSRVTPAVFCHSPYTCGPATLRQAKELARGQGVPFFIHVAETQAEVAQCREQQGTTPVRYLHGLGLLDPATVLIHCVWLTTAEIDLIAASGAAVVICPASHMKLASGVAPLRELLAAGVAVGLGTDGAASNNRLDLFREMDLVAKLHKVISLDPTALPAHQVLAMATQGGARALGLAARLGSLEPGKAADLIILDLRQPHLTPFYDADLLVYAARGSDVRTVIVDGKIVVRDRRLLTFDLAEVMARVNRLAARMRAGAG